MTFFAAIIALFYKRIKSKLSFNTIFIFLFLLMGTGYSIISISDSYDLIVLGLMISGLGMGLLLPNMNLYLVSVTSEIIRGRVLGGLISFIFLGQFISPLVWQPSFEMFGIENTFGFAGFSLIIVSVAFIAYRVKNSNIKIN